MELKRSFSKIFNLESKHKEPAKNKIASESIDPTEGRAPVSLSQASKRSRCPTSHPTTGRPSPLETLFREGAAGGEKTRLIWVDVICGSSTYFTRHIVQIQRLGYE